MITGFWRACFYFLAVTLAIAPAFAQTYPARTIRLIVPFTAGGASDIQGRLIAQKLSERWGQQVIVENRPGGTTVLATDMTARAAADGYTILFVTTAFAINPSLRKVPYDIFSDFSPVIYLSSSPNMLVAHPSVPANNAADLIKLAKARPGELNYASAGAGTAAHVSVELMQIMGGIKLTHIPYKGISQAFLDLMSGQVSLLITSPVAALPFVRQGKIKSIAVTSAKRSSAAPEVPTVAEKGIPGYEASGWQGLVAPAGVPRDIVMKLYNEIHGIMQLSDVKERLASDGSEYVGGTPDSFAAHIKAEHAKWAKVVKASGAKVD
ncbi:MAG: tripartite tricarboxylate transporter substrate binding protein [Burkholderiales bacterium]|nr:tripartite tricarboxylate transporter substrate binding protein [Burkholderiales bacterium]